MGALPIGHYKIVGLENVKVEEEESYDTTTFHFLPNNSFDMSSLTVDEIAILDKVVEKFESFSAKEIVDYMHKEIAYTKTKEKDIIPFSLAREISLM